MTRPDIRWRNVIDSQWLLSKFGLHFLNGSFLKIKLFEHKWPKAFVYDPYFCFIIYYMKYNIIIIYAITPVCCWVNKSFCIIIINLFFTHQAPIGFLFPPYSFSAWAHLCASLSHVVLLYIEPDQDLTGVICDTSCQLGAT